MKRMIAAILVLCMVLCSIPVAAAASFDEFFADVPAAVENDASYPFAESDDETCLISGNKGMGGTTSALKLTFRSGGTFRFSYKVSSESKYDYMAVTKNGTNLTKSNATSYSGAMTSFQTYTMEVAANDVVTIGYSKDYNGDRNDDTLYLKDFSCKTYYGVTFTGAPAGTAFTLTDSADASYAVTDGKASVPAGEYRYTAEAFGYAQATGSFTVTDAAVEVPVTMTELARHKAAFSIKGLAAGTTAAVTVKHGDEIMQAEEDGSYLLFPADYSYQVKAAGYKTARGTFTLGETDTTVEVTMVPGIEWDGTVADGFAGGTGTQADPYLISNGEELAYLSAQVASGNAFAGKYVILTANLDMGNVAFTPIGSDDRRFAGSFDGAYHTIDNLLVSDDGLCRSVRLPGYRRGRTPPDGPRQHLRPRLCRRHRRSGGQRHDRGLRELCHGHRYEPECRRYRRPSERQVRCALDRPALRELRHDQQWYEQFLGRYRWHCLLYYAERVL